MHEGEAVLPAEVHELNLSDTTVKIDSWREEEYKKSVRVENHSFLNPFLAHYSGDVLHINSPRES